MGLLIDRRTFIVTVLVLGATLGGAIGETGQAPLQSGIPEKISFLQLVSRPLVPRGDVDTGNAQLNDGFIEQSVFEDSFARGGNTLYALFRSGAEDISGIGMWTKDISNVTDIEELADRNAWELTHHVAPAIDLAEVQPGASGVTGALSASVIDDVLHVYFKPKRLRQEDVVARSKGGEMSIDLPYVVPTEADIDVWKRTSSGKKKIPAKHYSVANVGTGQLASVVFKK